MSQEEELAEASVVLAGYREENAELRQLVADLLMLANDESQSMAVYRKRRDALQARAKELGIEEY